MVRETFRPGEFDTLQKLAISLPAAPESIQKIAAEFNERFARLMEFVRRWYRNPFTLDETEDPLNVSFESLQEVGKIRRQHQWELLQAVRDTLAARAEAVRQIESLIKKIQAESREERDAVRASVENKLCGVLSGIELTRAVGIADAVLEAETNLKRAFALSPSLNSGVENVSTGDVRKLAEAIASRLKAIAEDVCCLEVMPSPHELGERYMGNQFIGGAAVVNQRKKTVHREEVDYTSN